MEPKEGGGFVPCSVETAAGILLRTRLARALLGSTILDIYYGNRSNAVDLRKKRDRAEARSLSVQICSG